MEQKEFGVAENNTRECEQTIALARQARRQAFVCGGISEKM